MMRIPTTTLLFILLCSLGAAAQAAEKPGPRYPIGPDVPLTDPEREQLGPQVTVEGLTAEAIQTACNRAVGEGKKVVHLPAGEYLITQSIRVPGGLVLLGDGAKTHLVTRDIALEMFRVDGDDVRISRMRLEGPTIEHTAPNESKCIHNYRHTGVRIDHVEMFGFSQANFFWGGAGQVDHSKVHDCPRDGQGYGVCIMEGAHVLVIDSEFSQCRHDLASNGALDWESPARLGRFVQKQGVRKTHWELIHSHVHHDDRVDSRQRLSAVDAHPGMDGTFLVEYNVFEKLNCGVGIRDGSGIIRYNLFRDIAGPNPAAVFVYVTEHNGIPVEGAMPHNVAIFGNRLENVARKYRIERAENVFIDGKVVENTRVAGRKPPEPIMRLQPVGTEYQDSQPPKE